MAKTTIDADMTTEIVVKALKMPGVKVDRRLFLLDTLPVADHDVEKLLKDGPIKSGLFSHAEIQQYAANICSKRRLQSSSASFAAGLPGGWTLAATIPADTLQFVGFNLRIAQEIAYLYDRKDFWRDSVLNAEAVRSELMLFLATMFGVGGAASATRVFSQTLAQQIAIRLPKQALTKTFYYPLIKTIAAYLGIKLTKDTFAKGVAKVVPVLGGVVSGGMTYVTMGKMSQRLREAFDREIDYSQEDERADMLEIKQAMPEVYDALFDPEENGDPPDA